MVSPRPIFNRFSLKNSLTIKTVSVKDSANTETGSRQRAKNE